MEICSGVPSWVAGAPATWPNTSSVASPLGSLPRCLLLSGCSLGFRLFGCLVAAASGARARSTRELVLWGVGGRVVSSSFLSGRSPHSCCGRGGQTSAELSWVRLRWLLSSPGQTLPVPVRPSFGEDSWHPLHLLSIASGSSCLFGGLYAGLSAPQKNRPVVSSRAEAVVLSHPSARGFPSRRYKHGFAPVSSAHRALPWEFIFHVPPHELSVFSLLKARDGEETPCVFYVFVATALPRCFY